MATTYYPKPPCVVRQPPLFSTAWPNPNMVKVKMIGSGSLGRRRRTVSLPRIKSSFDNEVFEDQSEGIVCYVDDSGRWCAKDTTKALGFIKKFPIIFPGSREGKIIGLLQRNWIQIIDVKDVYRSDDAIGAELTAREEFNQSGYNFN